MAEEHRCQAPEGHRLCANNCGFFGSPATMNLCSKCYRDHCLKEQQEKAIKSSFSAAATASASSSSSFPSTAAVELQSLSHPELNLPDVQNPVVAEQPPQPNRCFICRKRVGLTGFKCRCGTTFCGVHRYPEKHGCFFDFKTVGREEIAKANPLVVAEKLEKI